MSVGGAIRAWNEFFFAPQSPSPICLYRVLFGLLALAKLILLRPDWLTWLGPRGITTLDTMHRLEPGTRINLFVFLPTDAAVETFFWVAAIAAVFVIIGFLTRASSVLLFLCLVSIDERALYAVHAGDALLRTTGFWLMFAPAGAAFSVDRLLRIWKGKEGLAVAPRPPWAQRMIQFQVAILYLSTFWRKTMGPAWIDGTALYYVYHLQEFERFPLPSFLQDLPLIKLQTWVTLALEFALGVLIWFRELRYPILALGVLLHLSLEYSMNVPLFQWIALATYVTFIEPADLARVWKRVREFLGARFQSPVTVVYDGEAERVLRMVNVLRAVDVPGRLQFVDRRSEGSDVVRKGQRRLVLSKPGDALEAFTCLFRPSKRALSAAPAAK
jgi:hypothetical protein